MVNDVHQGITGSGARDFTSPGFSSGPSKQSDSGGALSRTERDETNEEDDGDHASSSASACATSVTHHSSHSRPLSSEAHHKDEGKDEIIASRRRKRVFMSVSETSVSSSGSEEHERTSGIGKSGGVEQIGMARTGGSSNSHLHPLRNIEEAEDGQLTTVEGQLRRNPHMSEEEARLAAKREYNRRNAARARSRNKSLLQDLQEKVSKLNRFTEELQRTNDILRAQLELLSQQNETLMAEAAAASSYAPSEAPMPQQALPPQAASLLNPTVTTAPLQVPPSQAQSLLNAVGLFSQLLHLQSLMNQAQQPQAQASQAPLPVQEQVSPPQAPFTPTLASHPGAMPGSTVTPSPTSRPLDGSAFGIAPSFACLSAADPPAAMTAEEGHVVPRQGVERTHHFTSANTTNASSPPNP